MGQCTQNTPIKHKQFISQKEKKIIVLIDESEVPIDHVWGPLFDFLTINSDKREKIHTMFSMYELGV